MFELPDASVPAGTVVQVMQPGYTIGERVLRPALVGVVKGGPKAPLAADAAANDNSGGKQHYSFVMAGLIPETASRARSQVVDARHKAGHHASSAARCCRGSGAAAETRRSMRVFLTIANICR